MSRANKGSTATDNSSSKLGQQNVQNSSGAVTRCTVLLEPVSPTILLVSSAVAKYYFPADLYIVHRSLRLAQTKQEVNFTTNTTLATP